MVSVPASSPIKTKPRRMPMHMDSVRLTEFPTILVYPGKAVIPCVLKGELVINHRGHTLFISGESMVKNRPFSARYLQHSYVFQPMR